MATEIDIEAEVFKKYPVIPEEAGCRVKRDHRNGLRHFYRLRLMKEQREQAEANIIQSTTLPPDETVGRNVYP